MGETMREARQRGFFDRLHGRRCAWPMLPPIGHHAEDRAHAYIDGWHAAAALTPERP